MQRYSALSRWRPPRTAGREDKAKKHRAASKTRPENPAGGGIFLIRSGFFLASLYLIVSFLQPPLRAVFCVELRLRSSPCAPHSRSYICAPNLRAIFVRRIYPHILRRRALKSLFFYAARFIKKIFALRLRNKYRGKDFLIQTRTFASAQIARSKLKPPTNASKLKTIRRKTERPGRFRTLPVLEPCPARKGCLRPYL